MSKNELIIVLIPVLLTTMLLINSLFRKCEYFKPFLVSIAFSSISLIFILARSLSHLEAVANVGFEIGIISSPVATIPLAYVGWKFGEKKSLLKILFSIIFSLSLYFSMAFSYIKIVQKNSLDQKVRTVLDCSKLPYHCAIRDQKLGEIEKLKSEGFNIEARDQWSGDTALWYGLHNAMAVQILIKNGASGNSINYQNETPLAKVLVINLEPNFEVARILLENGANINQKFGIKKQKTILNVAIISKDVKVVDFSLEHDADPFMKDDYDKNACDRMKSSKFFASKKLNEKCAL